MDGEVSGWGEVEGGGGGSGDQYVSQGTGFASS